nr:MAG: hypothetical protein [Microvirus sp.]
MKRRPMKRKSSKKLFAKTSKKVHVKNTRSRTARGGIRL